MKKEVKIKIKMQQKNLHLVFLLLKEFLEVANKEESAIARENP